MNFAMLIESFAFVSHGRFSRVLATAFMAPTQMESARVRYPKRPLSDSFYNLGSLTQECREHSVNLS